MRCTRRNPSSASSSLFHLDQALPASSAAFILHRSWISALSDKVRIDVESPSSVRRWATWTPAFGMGALDHSARSTARQTGHSGSSVAVEQVSEHGSSIRAAMDRGHRVEALSRCACLGDRLRTSPFHPKKYRFHIRFIELLRSELSPETTQ
jgi:hypothetical protein